MAAPATQRPPHIPTPDQILAGYERAQRPASSHPPIDLWCWRVVEKTIERLGGDKTLLRIAQYRQLHCSLHGFRIGPLHASALKPKEGAKGIARAEKEFHSCVEAAYEKWEALLIEVAENSKTCQ